MKISDLVNSYVTSPRMKAKLKKNIKLNNGYTFKKGTISELLIEREEGQYHFEADNEACIVSKNEITFI